MYKIIGPFMGLAMLGCSDNAFPKETRDTTSTRPTMEVLSQHPTISCLNTHFTSFIDVFGIYVIASDDAPTEKVLHTANILAEFIDNDEDGQPDDRSVLQHLVNHSYVVPVWTTEVREAFWMQVTGSFCEDNIGMAASMYHNEDTWALGGIEHAGTWDTNLEEVWHVVSVGWYNSYPQYFGEQLNNTGEVIPSKLTEAMDVARGGQFLETPDQYPAEAWYTYDDMSCGYPCQAHEYFYWITMANINALSPEITDKCESSAAEWNVCTQEELEQTDILAFELINNNGFHLPRNIPNGSYHPSP